MKNMLITIVAMVLVGCGTSIPDIPIHEAAFKGNIEAVKQHLAAGTDVNEKSDKTGVTPLHSAASWGRTEVVELLISKGADVNAKSESGIIQGQAPLDNAMFNGETETADLIRKHGGKYGVIHGAVCGGDIEVVKEFLATGTDVNARDYFGRTPLHHAAKYGHKEVAELLVAKGADVNSKDEFNKTPLDAAEGETADLLRKHGGKTGEELKPEKNNQKNIEALKKFSEIDELLRNRTSKSEADFEIVKRYLSSGADVNQRNKFGGSLLHIASVQGDKQLVRLLISEGAQLNVKNNRAMTPLDVSIKFKRTETINLLRKHGGKTAEELRAEGK